jgi:hypothetical protein
MSATGWQAHTVRGFISILGSKEGQIIDPDHSEDEDRFLLLGYSFQARCLIVSHCYHPCRGASLFAHGILQRNLLA